MINKIIEKLEGKRIAILGFGKEGKSTYHFLKKYGKNLKIAILDQNPIEIDDKEVEIVTGEDYLSHLENYDKIIKSPGISLKDENKKPYQDKITSQLELLLEVNKENVIGVTGTKGKSTTSTLIYEVLKDQLKNVYLLGNIGTPVLDKIEDYDEKSTLVIEMSSHQLEFLKESPHIACILNLYEDHLDHDGTLEHYHQNKMNIWTHQTEKDYCIYASDNEYLRKYLEKNDTKNRIYTVRSDDKENGKNSTRVKENKVFLNEECVYVDDDKRLLKGDHNLKNIMFALTVAKILGLDMEQAKKKIDSFAGLKYRMEYITTIKGVSYYNDTIATIPEATMNAIKTIPNIKTLIVGGMDRGIDYEEFIDFLKASSLDTIICMPTTGMKIGKALESSNKKIIYVNTLEEAYQASKQETKSGTSCLLSPAAASYEFFKNFEEKGKCFEELVRKDETM